MHEKQNNTFLSRFRLDDRVLQRGDIRTGKASVIGGFDPETGSRVVIKHWRRTQNVLDTDLQDIWHQELRQLHRLQGYPGAKEQIVSLLESGEDSNGFYLALLTGQRLPLANVLDSEPDQHWLKQAKLEKNRILIWSNFKRIARGLGILHTQGLLHRNLDSLAIYASGDEIADFQLSGFEWSIRLTANARVSPLTPNVSPGEFIVHSFHQDWQAFGALLTKTLGADPTSIIRRGRAGVSDLPYYLTGLERSLLSFLVRAKPDARIDSDVIMGRIDEIVRSLNSIITKRDDRLYLTATLGPNSDLSAAIRNASSRTIEMADIEAQLEFVRNDIRERPSLALVGAYAGEGTQRYLLLGRHLNYRLLPYRHIGVRGRTEPTWNIAITDSSADSRPQAADILDFKVLPSESVEVISRNELNRRFVSLQGRTPRWDQQLGDASSEFDSADSLRQYRALLLVQTLEALLIASEIWPVDIVDSLQNGGKTTLHLRYRADTEREKLSSALGLDSLATRMHEILLADQSRYEEDWKLTEDGVLGERDHERADWKFEDVIEEGGAKYLYVFEGTEPPPTQGALFLRKSSYQGTDRLMHRRVRALMALREHSELIDTIRDPGEIAKKTHETPLEDAAFFELDDSKQGTLKEIWATTPLYLLQGPPGVGKTRLVRELVRRRLNEDPSARILLSAQSHDAVVHLLGEIKKDQADLSSDVVVVRSRPRDDKRPSSEFDLSSQVKTLIDRVKHSRISNSLPLGLRQKLEALSFEAPSDDFSYLNNAQKRRRDRSVESLLLRGANLVFASTNSGDLERLIEERAQFDWSIIEEAGKATGPELLAPLLLSHRRLMIGDHKQLPPFGSDQLVRLLAEPTRISDALNFGGALIGRVFREAGLDDIEKEAKGADFASTCGEASAALMLFETLVENNLQKEKKSRFRLPIAGQLSEQHRMHPAIAELVAKTFYGGNLATPSSVISRFSTESPPFSFSKKSKILESPIVFIDMPWVQSTIGQKEIEKRPRYHNKSEVEVILRVLAQLQANENVTKPSIAILAPYREQTQRLKTAILESNNLGHLAKFDFQNLEDAPVGTVDSFQGNEADIVIISLVRNNARAGRRALGFLADPRRMNVLLSRARWKLIIVGSYEFLTSRFLTDALSDEGLAFLRDLLRVLLVLREREVASGPPNASLIACSEINLGGI